MHIFSSRSFYFLDAATKAEYSKQSLFEIFNKNIRIINV